MFKNGRAPLLPRSANPPATEALLEPKAIFFKYGFSHGVCATTARKYAHINHLLLEDPLA